MALALIPEVVEVGLLALLQVFNNVNICCPGPCCLSKSALPFLVPAPEDGSHACYGCSTTDLDPQLGFVLFLSSCGVDKTEGHISAKGALCH